MEGLNMYLQSTWELTLIIDTDKFCKLFDRVYGVLECLDDNKYADYTFTPKGITVLYHDSQYKKKIKLIVNPYRLLNSDEPDPQKLIRKLDKRINRYFNHKYTLNDFSLTGVTLATDINVHNKEKVAAYIKILHRIGKVKGFSPSKDDWANNNISFCLDGNSNGIKFMAYDLEGLCREQQSIAKKSSGILRVEVRLVKPKAIQSYTNEPIVSEQIADLCNMEQKIFLDTFMRVVPFGNFYKKDKAVEIVRAKMPDITIRRRMLRLLELVPEKKSLLLAQKALNYRRIDEVMEAFSDIEVAPITISKRHDIKQLKSLYSYL